MESSPPPTSDPATIGPLLVLGAPTPACDELRAFAQQRGQAFLIATDCERAREALAGRSPEYIVLAGTSGRSVEQVLSLALGDELYASRDGSIQDRQHFQAWVARSLEQSVRRKSIIGVMCIDVGSSAESGRPLEPKDIDPIYAVVEERLRSCLRDRDVLSRLLREDPGSREGALLPHRFMLLLELRRPHDAGIIGRRLMELLHQPIPLENGEHSLGFHIGIALHPQDGSRADELLALAESAAQEGREDGLQQVRYSSEAMNTASIELISLENALRLAVQRQEFEVFYQPKVAIADERIVGFEALVRWRHPELGLVPPVQFIPAAEETGLIIEIGEIVLRQACRDAVAWKRAGLPHLLMAVNISSVQFRNPDLYEQVLAILEEEGLPPTELELELTESMLMDDAEAAAVILNRFKKHGIRIAIDDFGTGYSSLNYLRRFPIDAIKIDRSFVTEVNTNPDDASIATSIILMGRSLKLRVIAEGVETRSQLSFLRVMQCDEVQGYLFSPPVPADRARAMLEAQQRKAA